jgi:hypothetical protein
MEEKSGSKGAGRKGWTLRWELKRKDREQKRGFDWADWAIGQSRSDDSKSSGGQDGNVGRRHSIEVDVFDLDAKSTRGG